MRKLKVGEFVIQGDVKIKKIKEIPDSCKEVKEDLLVRGEGADHGHFIRGGKVQVLEPENKDNVSYYLNVEEPSELQHLNISSGTKAEHLPIKIDKGQYEVVQQIQYDPYKQEIERVRD